MAKQGDDNNLLEFNRQLVDDLDELLSKEEWEKSLMLKATYKRLKNLREQAQALLEEHEYAQQPQQQSKEQLNEDETYIYIFLFQATGRNMSKWEDMIRTIPKYLLSRPVYAEEKAVRDRIKDRGDRKEEGYVKAKVKKDHIVSSYAGRAEEDHLGNELVTIRESSISLDSIVEFVHANSKRYKFVDGKLVAKDED